jgi:hypothetical protein
MFFTTQVVEVKIIRNDLVKWNEFHAFKGSSLLNQRKGGEINA